MQPISKFGIQSVAFMGLALVGAGLTNFAEAKETENVRVCLPVWKADAMKTAALLADSRQFFAKNGLSVSFVKHERVALKGSYNRGKAAYQIDDFAQADLARLNSMTVEKQEDRPCDVAVALSDAVLQSGVDPKKFEPLLFSRYGHGYDTNLIVPKNSNVKTIKDLKGKRIALGPVMSRVALDAMLKEAGMSSKDVTVVSSNPFERVRQMREGEIDAAIIYNPAMAILLSEGSVKVIDENIIEKYLKVPVPHTVLLANADFSKKNPKAISALVDAIEKGNKALADDPTLLATVTEEFAKSAGEKVHSYGVSKVVLAKSASLMGDFQLYRVDSMIQTGSGEMKVYEALGRFQDELIKFGYIGKKIDLKDWQKSSLPNAKPAVKSASVSDAY